MNTLIRSLLISLIIVFVTACGGGSSGSSGSSGDSGGDTTTQLQYVNTPYTDTIIFSQERLGQTFTSSDGAMWVLTGLSDGPTSGLGALPTVATSYTIYRTTSLIPKPLSGITGTYFMLVDGINTTYFLEYLGYPAIVKQDTIIFSQERVGQAFNSSDGAMWVLTGLSEGPTSGLGALPTVATNYTIYRYSSLLPSPKTGTTGAYFMLVDGINTTYFLEYLEYPAIVKQDTIIFSNEVIGNTFTSSDGAMWILTGTSEGPTSGLGALPTVATSYTIYGISSLLPSPKSGTTGAYFMLVDGINTTYFINRI